MDKKWEREPNYIEFTFHGFDCRLIRQGVMGYWMGYLIVDKEHAWFNLDQAELEWVEVHGKVSYTGANPFNALPDEDQFWIGFYCGHEFDLIPWDWVQNDGDRHPKLFKGHTYKDVLYASSNLEHMAYQAHLAQEHLNRFKLRVT